MDKKSLVNEMKEYNGGTAFINISQLARFRGQGRDKIKDLTKDIEFVNTGNQKMFFVGDVAEEIMKERVM